MNKQQEQVKLQKRLPLISLSNKQFTVPKQTIAVLHEAYLQQARQLNNPAIKQSARSLFWFRGVVLMSIFAIIPAVLGMIYTIAGLAVHLIAWQVSIMFLIITVTFGYFPLINWRNYRIWRKGALAFEGVDVEQDFVWHYDEHLARVSDRRWQLFTVWETVDYYIADWVYSKSILVPIKQKVQYLPKNLLSDVDAQKLSDYYHGQFGFILDTEKQQLEPEKITEITQQYQQKVKTITNERDTTYEQQSLLKSMISIIVALVILIMVFIDLFWQSSPTIAMVLIVPFAIIYGNFALNAYRSRQFLRQALTNFLDVEPTLTTKMNISTYRAQNVYRFNDVYVLELYQLSVGKTPLVRTLVFVEEQYLTNDNKIRLHNKDAKFYE
ncbi:MAG TPA: hypothetical protein VGM95_06325 [Lactobacillaceae bacterium]